MQQQVAEGTLRSSPANETVDEAVSAHQQLVNTPPVSSCASIPSLSALLSHRSSLKSNTPTYRASIIYWPPQLLHLQPTLLLFTCTHTHKHTHKLFYLSKLRFMWLKWGAISKIKDHIKSRMVFLSLTRLLERCSDRSHNVVLFYFDFGCCRGFLPLSSIGAQPISSDSQPGSIERRISV